MTGRKQRCFTISAAGKLGKITLDPVPEEEP